MELARANRRSGRPSSVWEGKRYGSLVALSRVEDELSRSAVWLMQCDCGHKILATTANLRTLTHCGCQSERWKPGSLGYKNRILKKRPSEQVTIVKQIYAHYRHGAQKRGYSFELGFMEFINIIASPCHYCGAECSNIYAYRGKKIAYNGIDRKDNDQGYVLDNVIPCCIVCNEAKMDRPYQEFIDWVHRVHSYLTKGQPDGRIEN